jgi:hypothetical protein
MEKEEGGSADPTREIPAKVQGETSVQARHEVDHVHTVHH